MNGISCGNSAAPSPEYNDRQASDLARTGSAANISSRPRSSSQNPIAEITEDDDALSSPKTQDILEACRWRDISRLRSLAEAKGGFLSDALRRHACMLILFIARRL